MRAILFTFAGLILIFAPAAHRSRHQADSQAPPQAADATPTPSGYILGPDEGDAVGGNLIKVDPARGSMRLAAGTQSFRAGRGIPLHMHEGEDEILFIHEGTGTGVVGKEQRQLTPGTTLYIPLCSKLSEGKRRRRESSRGSAAS